MLFHVEMHRSIINDVVIAVVVVNDVTVSVIGVVVVAKRLTHNIQLSLG